MVGPLDILVTAILCRKKQQLLQLSPGKMTARIRSFVEARNSWGSSPRPEHNRTEDTWNACTEADGSADK